MCTTCKVYLLNNNDTAVNRHRIQVDMTTLNTVNRPQNFKIGENGFVVNLNPKFTQCNKNYNIMSDFKDSFN